LSIFSPQLSGINIQYCVAILLQNHALSPAQSEGKALSKVLRLMQSCSWRSGLLFVELVHSYLGNMFVYTFPES
jgi:hypothetical protein